MSQNNRALNQKWILCVGILCTLFSNPTPAKAQPVAQSKKTTLSIAHAAIDMEKAQQLCDFLNPTESNINAVGPAKKWRVTEIGDVEGAISENDIKPWRQIFMKAQKPGREGAELQEFLKKIFPIWMTPAQKSDGTWVFLIKQSTIQNLWLCDLEVVQTFNKTGMYSCKNLMQLHETYISALAALEAQADEIIENLNFDGHHWKKIQYRGLYYPLVALPLTPDEANNFRNAEKDDSSIIMKIFGDSDVDLVLNTTEGQALIVNGLDNTLKLLKQRPANLEALAALLKGEDEALDEALKKGPPKAKETKNPVVQVLNKTPREREVETGWKTNRTALRPNTSRLPKVQAAAYTYQRAQ